jgi:hypothetical protein
MAGKVANIKVCSPLKLRSGMIGNYHAICHYLYNLPLASLKYLYSLMSDSQLKKVESFPNFPPPPTIPNKVMEPMRVEMGINDKDPNAPPPPPKAIKVIKGVNDTKSNIPPPPPKKLN